MARLQRVHRLNQSLRTDDTQQKDTKITTILHVFSSSEEAWDPSPVQAMYETRLYVVYELYESLAFPCIISSCFETSSRCIFAILEPTID
jgi:hypothetical protein